MKNAKLLSGLHGITGIVCVLMGTLPIIAVMAGENISEHFSGFVAFMFFGISLCFIFPIIRSIDKRLSDIEERMNQSDR